jgi:hypothetical protein
MSGTRGYWTCQRVTGGARCGGINRNRVKYCKTCHKPRPPRKKPVHMAALEQSYEQFIELNGGENCGICGATRPKTGRRLDRDHDHRSGKGRGLLCHSCNRALSNRATVEWAWAAWRYLIVHQLRNEDRLRWVEEDRGHATPCWIWQRALHSGGYAVIRYAGELLYVHRLMCAAEIPEGYQVDHLCRQRACVNPSHLEVVTPGVNSRRGAKARLTQERALEIRDRRRAGETTVALSNEFGIAPSTVTRIANGQRWGV